MKKANDNGSTAVKTVRPDQQRKVPNGTDTTPQNDKSKSTLPNADNKPGKSGNHGKPDYRNDFRYFYSGRKLL